MMMIKYSRAFVALIAACWAAVLLQPNPASASSCSQSPAGYYKPPTPGGSYVTGLPSTNSYSYQTKPSTLSCSELSQAHQLCVERINMYRSGQLVFSNGSSDPTLGSPPQLKYASGMDKCHSEITMGDYALMGTCSAGAHQNAWSCDGYDWSWGQNLCCPRLLSTTNTFQSLITAMYGCLQSMWDEGMHPTTGTTGHWENMKDPSFLYASCGFAFGTQNSAPYVLMTQNFGGWYGGQTTSLTASTAAPTTGTTTQATTLSPTSKAPTAAPTLAPSSKAPTLAPSSKAPTAVPTLAPSSKAPTLAPSSKAPTVAPTLAPSSKAPTLAPSSKAPTAAPTLAPSSKAPTATPTLAPSSKAPTVASTLAPTTALPVTAAPSTSPISTSSPTRKPTPKPTPYPTRRRLRRG